MNRIGIFYPAYGSRIHPQVLLQYGAELEHALTAQDYTIVTGWTDTLGIDLVRNSALEWARQEGLDYLYFQDADTWGGIGTHTTVPVVPILYKIAQERGATVVVAPVKIARREHEINCQPWRDGEVYEGREAGSGLMLISVKQVDRIAREYTGPWFRRVYADPRHARIDTTGDHYFCRVVREHKGEVWIAGIIPTSHSKSHTLVYVPTDGESTGDSDSQDGDDSRKVGG